jgi:hypothetical protein
MRILSGRNFVAQDMGRDVVIINEAAAKGWWPGEHPVGKTIFSNDRTREIVGVVSDSYNNDLSSIEAVIYFPITGRFGAPAVVVHDRGVASRDRITAILKQIEPRAQVRAQPLAVSFQQKHRVRRVAGGSGAGDRFSRNGRRVRVRGGPTHARD